MMRVAAMHLTRKAWGRVDEPCCHEQWQQVLLFIFQRLDSKYWSSRNFIPVVSEGYLEFGVVPFFRTISKWL
jgi:hypothetical protein